MLKGVHVAFIGGDARQLEVIKKFIELDAIVSLIGYDHLENDYLKAAKAGLSPGVLANIDALILPISGVDAEGYVESIFCSESMQLTGEHLDALPKQCTLYTGITKPWLKNLVSARRLEIVELMNRDDVAIFNSIPTVEGALMMAIQNTDITIHGANILVLGFGRTGMSLSRTLHDLGGLVREGVRRPEQMARITEMRMTPFHIQDLIGYVGHADMIFNTIPSRIISHEQLDEMHGDTVIIDLASSPGGTDFKYAEEKGIKAILAPGLPGIVAPKTAGQIMANILSQLVFEQKKTRR